MLPAWKPTNLGVSILTPVITVLRVINMESTVPRAGLEGTPCTIRKLICYSIRNQTLKLLHARSAFNLFSHRSWLFDGDDDYDDDDESKSEML